MSDMGGPSSSGMGLDINQAVSMGVSGTLREGVVALLLAAPVLDVAEDCSRLR